MLGAEVATKLCPRLGMSAEESAGLLKFLFAHSVKPEFTFRHHWQPFDLVLWDNRCTMHLAPKDYASGAVRQLERHNPAVPKARRAADLMDA